MEGRLPATRAGAPGDTGRGVRHRGPRRAHLNKSPGGNALYRVGGSIGLVGAARSLLAFGRDPDDPDGERGPKHLCRTTLTPPSRRAGKPLISTAFPAPPAGLEPAT